MTSGKNLSYYRRVLRRIKTWYLVMVLIILFILAVVFLRINNLNMMEYREEVITADTTLDRAKIETAAESLKLFVSAHMNADTGLIPLQNLYNQAVSDAFNSVNEVDSSVYSTATEACKAVLSQKGYSGYSSCVADYVGISESDFNQPNLPNPALYYLSYASPKWSFDPAGILVVATTVVFSAIVLKLSIEVILGLIIRYREKK